MLTRFWWTADRNPLSQARAFLASWMLGAFERFSYALHFRLYGHRYTLCARAHDLQRTYSLLGIVPLYNFWAIFRRVADFCHSEPDHCKRSAERHL